MGDAPYMAFRASSSSRPFSSPVGGSTTAAECAPPAEMRRTRAPGVVLEWMYMMCWVGVG